MSTVNEALAGGVNVTDPSAETSVAAGPSDTTDAQGQFAEPTESRHTAALPVAAHNRAFQDLVSLA